MIICRKVEGEVKVYKLRYSSGISLQNSGDGSVIYPNYEYWAERFGEYEEVQLGVEWGELKDEYNSFFENHWIERGIYHRTIDLCQALGIDLHHADNIVIPLSDFEMADRTLIGKDIKEVARDVRKLTDLFIELENHYRKVISVTFEVGRIKGINTTNGWYHFTDERIVKVEVPRAIDPFIKAIQRLVKTDVELNSHIHGETYREFENQSLDNHHWQMKNLRGAILFEYLINHKLAKSKRDGYIKTGKFMSLMSNEYMLDEATFADHEEDFLEYKSYDYYLADVMGKRIERYYRYRKSVTENS